MNNLFDLLNKPFISNLLNRFANRWTAHGVVILILQLEHMGILPQDAAQVIDGLSTEKILPWLVIAIGIYFIVKMPSKTERANNRVEYLKAQIEIVKLEKLLKATQRTNSTD